MLSNFRFGDTLELISLSQIQGDVLNLSDAPHTSQLQNVERGVPTDLEIKDTKFYEK